MNAPVTLSTGSPPDRFRSIARMAFVLLCLATMMACSKPAPTPAAPTAQDAASKSSSQTAPEPTDSILPAKAAFDPLGSGRDPFFPLSSRLPRQTSTNQLAVIDRPQLPLSRYLKLTGLWPVQPNSLAFINKTDFRPGDRGTVTVLITNGQNQIEPRQVIVRCIEIRRESVVISVEGEPGTKELRLPALP